MKKLFILRHAKSSWNDPDLSDIDRPLNGRGRNAAPFMGEFMARKHLLPDIILSSPAKRAMETALLVKETGGMNAAIKYDERIYEASPHTLRQAISETDEKLNAVLLVGHNPGVEGFTKFLTGESEAMTTAALAVIELDIDAWKDIATATGRLKDVIRPKEEMKNLDISTTTEI